MGPRVSCAACLSADSPRSTGGTANAAAAVRSVRRESSCRPSVNRESDMLVVPSSFARAGLDPRRGLAVPEPLRHRTVGNARCISANRGELACLECRAEFNAHLDRENPDPDAQMNLPGSPVRFSNCTPGRIGASGSPVPSSRTCCTSGNSFSAAEAILSTVGSCRQAAKWACTPGRWRPRHISRPNTHLLKQRQIVFNVPVVGDAAVLDLE